LPSPLEDATTTPAALVEALCFPGRFLARMASSMSPRGRHPTVGRLGSAGAADFRHTDTRLLLPLSVPLNPACPLCLNPAPAEAAPRFGWPRIVVCLVLGWGYHDLLWLFVATVLVDWSQPLSSVDVIHILRLCVFAATLLMVLVQLGNIGWRTVQALCSEVMLQSSAIQTQRLAAGRPWVRGMTCVPMGPTVRCVAWRTAVPCEGFHVILQAESSTPLIAVVSHDPAGAERWYHHRFHGCVGGAVYTVTVRCCRSEGTTELSQQVIFSPDAS